MSDFQQPQFSVPGFPARFGTAHTVSNTVLTHTFNGPADVNNVYILQGVDCSMASTCIEAVTWIIPPSGGKTLFYSKTLDPVDPLNPAYLTSFWRGNLPIREGETCEVGIETLSFCDIALMAWGVWMPVDLFVIT